MTHTLILKAAHFSAQKHRKHHRKDEDASPYINHPISVALEISQTGGVNNPEILAAALLHDTIEDTATTPEEIEEKHRCRPIFVKSRFPEFISNLFVMVFY